MNNSTVYTALKGMGLNRGYCSQIANGGRKPGLGLAIEVFKETGIKLGPIAKATPKEIQALEKCAPPSKRKRKNKRA